MARYPVRGERPWDDQLRKYIDTRLAENSLRLTNPDALGPWWAALQNAKTQPVRAAFFGSSTTAGFNATDPEKRWVNRLINQFQSVYPSGGAETPTMLLSAGVANPPTAPGVQGFNGGISGTNTSNYLGSIAIMSIGILDPVLIVHMPDSNDSPGQAIPPSQTKANIEAVIDQINPARCHLLIHTYRRVEAGVTKAQWAEYGRVKREIAESRPNVAFLDISQMYDAARGSTDPYDLIDTDTVHQTDAGHEFMASLVAQGLGLSRVGPPGPEGPVGPRGPAADATSLVTYLGPTGEEVDLLANVNEWQVSGPVHIGLPHVDAGSQFTVHVLFGFQHITWPNGATIYGETDQDDVWITLIRGVDGWNVLIPSPPLAGGSGAGLDTGWVNILAAYNFGTPTWVTGSAADVGPGWGPGVAPDFALNVKIRRTGNTLHVAVVGLTKTDTSGTIGADHLFTLPAGIVIGTGNHSNAVVPYHTASVAPAGLAILGVGADRRVSLYMPDGTVPPVGTILGRTSGSDVYGNVMMSFPIEPSSIWGT